MRRRAHFARVTLPLATFPGALIIATVFATVFATPLAAQQQHLRDQISSLFIFGPGDDPLFLAGSADPSNPASIQAHGKHFIPSSQAENGSVISFIIDAVGQSASNVPFGSTSGGETFKFVGGVASGSLHGWVWFAFALAGGAIGIPLRPLFGLSKE